MTGCDLPGALLDKVLARAPGAMRAQRFMTGEAARTAGAIGRIDRRLQIHAMAQRADPKALQQASRRSGGELRHCSAKVVAAIAAMFMPMRDEREDGLTQRLRNIARERPIADGEIDLDPIAARPVPAAPTKLTRPLHSSRAEKVQRARLRASFASKI
jgi:hypothetical protein